MRTLFFLFFFLLVKNIIFCQNVTISEDIAVRNDKGYQILGRYNGNQTLLFRDKGDDFEVVSFNEQLKIVSQKKISFPEKRIEILDAIGGNDFFAVIYTCKEKSELKVKIHRFDSNAKFIDSATVKNFGNRFAIPTLKNIFSENNKKILLYSFENNSDLDVTTFDIENMKVLWQKKYSIPEGINSNSDFIQALVSNDGNTFFIFEKDEAASLFGSNKHDLSIIELTSATENYNNVSLKEIATYALSFKYDNVHKQLCCVGLFSEKNKTRPIGTFIFKTNDYKNFDLVVENFGDDLVAAVLGKPVNNNKGLSDLRIQDILLRKDGGAVAVLEEYRQVAHISNATNRGMNMADLSGRFVTDYYCDNVILMSFNNNGSLHWKKVLAKKQFSQGDQGIFSSFGLMRTPSEVRFLFNDDARFDTTTSEYVLKGDGSVDRHSMFNTTNQEILLRFRDGLQVASDEYIVPSELRGRLRIVRLKY